MLNDIKEFLRSIWKKLRSKKFIKRYSWLIIISVLTLLIPLSIALCYMQFVENQRSTPSENISVTIFEPNGDILYSDETPEKLLKDSYLSKLIFDLSSTKIKTSKPTEFTRNQNLGFSISYGKEKSIYKCYFEENISESYFEDQNGTFYSPAPEAYSSFLNSLYAESIYKEATPPTLYTDAKENVIPISAEWNYALTNKKEVPAKKLKTTEDLITYRITGAINLTFSRTPDICSVEIKKPDGTLVFSGEADGLNNVTANEGDELLIKMNAEWKQNAKFSSYGIQDFEFKVICSEPSSFSLSSTTAFGGQVIIISANNVTYDDTISYSVISNDLPDPPVLTALLSKEERALASIYSYQPIFVKEGSNAYAFLPIPADIPDTVFKFSLSCGISKSEFSLDLKKATQIEFSTQDSVNKVAISAAQKAEFSRIILSLKHSNSDMLLTKDEFLSPLTYGFAINHSYNTQINKSFTFLANSFSAPSSIEMRVKSVGIGTVSLAGNSPLLGNYAIVDHGMGLLVWYCGLSTLNVEVGDILKTGDTIGLSGSSSLLCNNGVNIICSIGGILISPDEILGKSLIQH